MGVGVGRREVTGAMLSSAASMRCSGVASPLRPRVSAWRPAGTAASRRRRGNRRTAKTGAQERARPSGGNAQRLAPAHQTRKGSDRSGELTQAAQLV
jgi:hypothetical protein